ncbi:cation-transporting P-type ATPase [soil metagenome]
MTEQLVHDRPWHAAEPAEVAERLDTHARAGLGADAVSERLERYGRNELADDPPPSPLLVLLRQFKSPLIYILLAATVATVALAEYLDAAVIAVVLTLNAVIGFTQERKAEGAVRALMGLVVPHARVVRDGSEAEIDSRDLVPGDVVLLEPGSRVPADLRLVASTTLQIDESLLTGESLPVHKSTTAVDTTASLADRTDMAYTGAVVTSGRGRGIVVATGEATELGSIAGLVRNEQILETPLQQRMGRFATTIGLVVGVAAIVVFVSGMLLGGTASEMFLTAVALAVAAIPEGLPVVFTITLALGVRRMAQRNAIIRRLPAVETLGSTTVIGSDKTGTLTENRMTVRLITVMGERGDSDGAQHFTLVGTDPESGFALADAAEHGSVNGHGEGVVAGDHPAPAETLRGGVLANEADLGGERNADEEADAVQVIGDPTEVALLRAAVGAGIDPGHERRHHRIVAEIPFESERRYSAVFCRADGPDADADAAADADPAADAADGPVVVYVKGAPERVIDMCTHVMVGHERVPIDREAARVIAHEMAAEGLRVLGVARGALDAPPTDPERPDEPSELTVAGYLGMLDPPRAGVKEAIATCHHAGMRVAMITGDHAVTARAIAADLGIAAADDEVLTGADLADLDDDELAERVQRVAVYARVAPEEKLRIVESMQSRGDVVAVTGDGVNDAPALRAAAIGIAMGQSGTDVAREASDMVLTDDNFVSIAAAVEEGRVTFDNVRKVTFFLVSTGVASILAITVGVWLQWPLIMLPAQLLWLNLVTNGLQDVALAFEPKEEGVLDRPPRRTDEGILSGLLWQRSAIAGAVMAAGALVMFRWELDRSDSLMAAQTVALTTMVIFMALHAGNSRSEARSLFTVNPLTNPFLLMATTAAVGVHVLALYLPPTQFVLRIEPLDTAAWIRILPIALAIIVAMEIDKAVRRRGRTSSAVGSAQ